MIYNRYSEMTIDVSFWGQVKAFSYFAFVTITAYLGLTGVKMHLIEVLAWLMLVDTATGYWKWRRCDPRLIKSKSMKEGVYKKFVSLIIPIILALVFKALEQDISMMLNAYFTVLCVAEGYSAISNLQCAITRDPKEEFDAVSAVLKFAKDKLFVILQQLTGAKPEQKPDDTPPAP